MTPQDILDELDAYGFDEDGVPTKLKKINNTIKDVCARLPWRFLETETDLNFDGTNAKPSNWPSDFRALESLTRNDTGQRLQWKRKDVFYYQHTADRNESGDPMFYYFVGRELRVWRVPAATTGLLHMPYLRRHPDVLQTDPESAILIPSDHHEVIVWGSLYKLYDQNDDFDLSQRFQGLYEQRLQVMQAELDIVQFDYPDLVYDVDNELQEFIF